MDPFTDSVCLYLSGAAIPTLNIMIKEKHKLFILQKELHANFKVTKPKVNMSMKEYNILDARTGSVDNLTLIDLSFV